MNDILSRLSAAWISPDLIQRLQSWLGDRLESEIMNEWLRKAAEKVGIDSTNLPDIDLKNAFEAVEEMTGKDINRDGKIGDGDGKTGIIEALENGKEAFVNSDLSALKKSGGGFLAHLKKLLGI